MGFIAEEIQEKDKNLIDFKSIYDPVPGSRFTFSPREWCIDHERNAIFVSLPRIGRPEPGDPDQYALVLDGAVVGVDLFKNVELTVPRKVTWTLARLHIGKNVTASREDVISILKGALGAYTHAWLSAPGATDEQIDIEYHF